MVPVKAVCIWRMSYLMKSVTRPLPCSDFSCRSFRKGATCRHVKTLRPPHHTLAPQGKRTAELHVCTLQFGA